MIGKTIVLALGGNALQRSDEEPTLENQLKNINLAANSIIELIENGMKVVITHGNGPQVGRLILQSEKADSKETPAFDFDVAGAMSQAQIGYQLQQALYNKLQEKNLRKNVVTIITQIEVDQNDLAFANPTKPIGPFYEESDIKRIQDEKGYTLKEDSNRGYRRVIASPKPQKILELGVIENTIANGDIVICCGGGGVPVIKENNQYKGIAGVIDKDFASSLLAENINADYLAILTAVNKVSLNYGFENQIDLTNLSLKDAKEYISDEHFAKGSMLPKVEASLSFVESTGKKAIITDLENIYKTIINEKDGTVIS